MCRRFWIKGLWIHRAAPRYPFEKLLMFVILNNPSDENDWLILPIFPFCDFQLFLEEIAREISNADKEWSIIWRRYFSLVGAHESVELLLEWRWYWDLKIRSISCLSFYLQKIVWIAFCLFFAYLTFGSHDLIFGSLIVPWGKRWQYKSKCWITRNSRW